MFGVIELTMTTKNVEKMGETAQQMSQSAQRAGRIFNGYLAEAQEINTEFARRATETWIEAIRNQTELNQRMVQRLYGEGHLRFSYANSRENIGRAIERMGEVLSRAAAR